MSPLPYRDSELPIEDRIADLMARMTVEEKAGQLTQLFHFSGHQLEELIAAAAHSPEATAVVAQIEAVDQGVADGTIGSLLFVSSPAQTNRLQRIAVGSRLGIPLMFGFDVIHGLRTVFPVPIGLAASWNPSIIEQAQTIAAREARSVGIHWTFAPMIDISRDARWGRIVEGAGEDPHLGAAVAAAQVRGFQGTRIGEPGRIIAGPKHFTGYGAAAGGRDYDEADISENTLWNVYLPPFRAAIDAGAGNVMSAYMDLNGIPATGNSWLLNHVLRDELGFQGFVVSDANAVRSLTTQHFAEDLTDAGARALVAGTDMEMALFDPAFSRLPEAIADGRVTVERLDDAVRRVLRTKFQMGLFEDPFIDEKAAVGTLDAATHREAARVAAEHTAVLLKNDGNLPLTRASLGSIAVLGHLADSKRDTLGPWVSDVDFNETITILEGITAHAGSGTRVAYAPGVRAAARHFPSPFADLAGRTAAAKEDFDDDAEFARAVALAASSDVAVVVLGQNEDMIGESASTSTLDLPGRQLELLQAVEATGTPVVLVVLSGRPLDLRWAKENIPAILHVWYPGSQGGAAVARLLFGDVSPAGRLPFTWPRSVGQVPLYYGHLTGFQPETQGRRYWDEESTPLYPFGYGLSYATFRYSALTLDKSSMAVGETAVVSVDVSNESPRSADEVVQLYIHQRHGTSSRPVRELKGFQRVTVPGHSTRTVRFPLGPDELRYWSPAKRAWTQDATTIDVWVGGDVNADLAGVLKVRNGGDETAPDVVRAAAAIDS